jgi:hypothetical protein
LHFPLVVAQHAVPDLGFRAIITKWLKLLEKWRPELLCLTGKKGNRRQRISIGQHLQ